MIRSAGIGRRLILSRLAGGGAVFCLFSARAGRNAASAATAGRSARAPAPPIPAPLIIVDPGHGGRDPGATGATGTLEKDVTLASALTLKSALEARGRYRVELTRTRDQY